MDILLCVIIGVIIVIAIIAFAYYIYGKHVKIDNKKGGYAYIEQRIPNNQLVGIILSPLPNNVHFFVLNEEGNRFVDINKSYVSKEFWLYLKNNIPTYNSKHTLLNAIKSPYEIFEIPRSTYSSCLRQKIPLIMKDYEYNPNKPFNFYDYLDFIGIDNEKKYEIILAYLTLANSLYNNKYIDFVQAIYQISINTTSESKNIETNTNGKITYSSKITRNTNNDMIHKLFAENVRNWYSNKFVKNNCYQYRNSFTGLIEKEQVLGESYEVADIYPAFKLLRMIYFLYAFLVANVEDHDAIIKMIASYVMYANAINIAAACKMEKIWNAKISNEYAYEKVPRPINNVEYNYGFSKSFCCFLCNYFNLPTILVAANEQLNDNIINKLSVVFSSYEKNNGLPNPEKYKAFKTNLLNEIQGNVDPQNINALNLEILK